MQSLGGLLLVRIVIRQVGKLHQGLGPVGVVQGRLFAGEQGRLEGTGRGSVVATTFGRAEKPLSGGGDFHRAGKAVGVARGLVQGQPGPKKAYLVGQYRSGTTW